MSMRIYEGIVVDGKVQLPADVHLPEKSRVLVSLSDESPAQPLRIHSPRLGHRGQAEDFVMNVEAVSDAGV